MVKKDWVVFRLNVPKKDSDNTDIRSLYNIAHRIYVYRQLMLRLKSKLAGSASNQSAARIKRQKNKQRKDQK